MSAEVYLFLKNQRRYTAEEIEQKFFFSYKRLSHLYIGLKALCAKSFTFLK